MRGMVLSSGRNGVQEEVPELEEVKKGGKENRGFGNPDSGSKARTAEVKKG
jgi:hypothetical protein